MEGRMAESKDLHVLLRNTNRLRVKSLLAVDVAPRGDAIVAWTVPDLQPNGYSVGYCGGTSLVAATRPAGGSFSAPVTLDRVSPGGELGVSGAAVDSSGDAVVLWRDHTCSIHPSDTSEIRAATRPAGGSFSAKQTLDSSALLADASFARDGSALVFWHRAISGWEEESVSHGILAARARPGSGFGRAGQVASGADRSGAPSLARDPGGRALAAWVENGGVRAAVERRSGGFCAQTVSPPPGDFALLGPFTNEPPDITAGRSGEAVAVWHQFDRIEAAIGTADRKRPVLRRLSVRTRRRRVRLSLRLSEASRVRVRLARRMGRRYRRVDWFVRSLPAGRTKLTLAGRRGPSLGPGSYRASARAVDCDGRRSKRRRTSFSVRR